MSDTPMGESYDSAEMQQLRQNMLDGVWDKEGCMSCWKKEEQGNISQRQKWLLRKPHDFKSQEGYNNPQLTGNPVNHMFINYSNICNFKCRMCGPNFSNSLIPEHKHLHAIGLGKKVKVESIKNRNFINDYLKNNPSSLDNVNSIWITGGEPLMDNSCYDLIDILNDYDKAYDTDMVLTTNGSKVDLDKLQKFENLKFFELDLSIDAPNNMFEYMRSAGVYSWAQMSSLIDDLTHFRKENSSWFHMCFNSSIQALNFDTVLEFDKICRDADALNNTRMLIFPEHFRLDVLPIEMRQAELKKIKDYTPAVYDTRFQRTFIDICNNMSKPQANKDTVNKFKEFTKAQDTYRNTNLQKYHTQLAEFVYTKDF